jgi:glycosyltransferase involved in cell wall biosynthesis
VRIALLTEGGYPYARGESVEWCDRLLRGLPAHEFDVYALSRGPRQERAGRRVPPPHVRRVRTAPLWGDVPAEPRGTGGRSRGLTGRRERRRFAGHFADLAAAVCAAGQPGGDPAPADRFASGLHGLAALARHSGGLPAALRSEEAVRALEAACRAPGALRAAQSAQVADLLAVAARLERALRPLSLDWYGDREAGEGLAAADLCHAVGGGPAALAGLLAQRAHGTPLLLTEYGVRLREHYLAGAGDLVAPAVAGAPVRALLGSFQQLLAREVYTHAQLITPGTTQTRRWQEHCGAPRDRLRTVYPGTDAAPFAALGEEADSGRPRRGAGPTLVWVGRVEPAADLAGLLHAFARVRAALPGARLRLVGTGQGRVPGAAAHAAHCRALAARLFPPEPGPGRVTGEPPVTFEEAGGPGAAAVTGAYADADVVVLPHAAGGFPVRLVEAMFCGRATVSTDVGAVCEVIGGTGLVVPPRDPHALADACLALLRDPARRARLGAASRARALELFTVERNVEAFRGIYLELMSRGAVGDAAPAAGGVPQPFARPAEAHVPGRWTGAVRPSPPVPSWARAVPVGVGKEGAR